MNRGPLALTSIALTAITVTLVLLYHEGFAIKPLDQETGFVAIFIMAVLTLSFYTLLAEGAIWIKSIFKNENSGKRVYKIYYEANPRKKDNASQIALMIVKKLNASGLYGFQVTFKNYPTEEDDHLGIAVVEVDARHHYRFTKMIRDLSNEVIANVAGSIYSLDWVDKPENESREHHSGGVAEDLEI